MTSTVSIVTPSFNQSDFLEAALNSVLGQGVEALEYVVIDGGSSDRSPEILERYGAQLKYWCSEPDGGHGQALNKGFAHTTGEIMGWLNSDDLYTPWCLRTVVEVFEAFPDVEWIVGFNGWWNSRGAMLRARREPKNIYDFLMGRYAWVQQESVFWRRSLWEKAGGFINEEYKFMIDGELWTRFFLHAELYTVDAILGGYRFQPHNRAVAFKDNCLKEMDRAVASLRLNSAPEYVQKADIFAELNESLRGTKRWHEKAHQLRVEHWDKFQSISYKNIHWENETWAIRNLPFVLSLDGYP